MRGEELEVRNAMMACYAMSLCQGDTIKATAIKLGTIKKYLKQASLLSTKANGKRFYDPCLDEDGKMAEHLKAVLDEHGRWEKMPNRREPLTKTMVKAQHAYCRTARYSRFTGEQAAMRDWLTFGIFSGVRRGEWAMESANLATLVFGPDELPRQFCMHDLVFYGPGRSVMDNDDAVHIATAASVDVTWRFQKNKDNGQTITFTPNPDDEELCPVRALLNIRRRAQLLGLAMDHPLAAYDVASKRGPAVIHSGTIRRCLRRLAKSCYGITKAEDLALYTSHSIRVGACVALHIAGKATEFIQSALRWRSDAFKMYLRNVVVIAQQRVTALNAFSPDGTSSDVAAVAV